MENPALQAQCRSLRPVFLSPPLRGAPMPTAEEIYRETVQPLPAPERLRLAELILEGLAGPQEPPKPRRTMADLIASLPPGPRCFSTWEEYEKVLAEEKAAW